MTETPPEAPRPLDVPEEATSRDAVYDEAELHFVEAVRGETARQTAARLNKGNEVGRADGSDSPRFVVRKV